MDVLEKKIKRLLAKLKKVRFCGFLLRYCTGVWIWRVAKSNYYLQHNLYLHVFEHSDIHYGPTLGKGGEGIVQKCTVMYNDLPVDAAVKTVLNNSDDALDLTFHEIELLWWVHEEFPKVDYRMLIICIPLSSLASDRPFNDGRIEDNIFPSFTNFIYFQSCQGSHNEDYASGIWSGSSPRQRKSRQGAPGDRDGGRNKEPPPAVSGWKHSIARDLRPVAQHIHCHALPAQEEHHTPGS